jgi:hypothetical protein
MNQSCVNHNGDKKEAVSEEEKEEDGGDRYYVRYVISATTKDAKIPRLITVKTDKAFRSIKLKSKGRSSTWKATYGPVKKGFETFLECKVPDYNDYSAIHARIYVCIEEEPFVIKADSNAKDSLALKYKIDF